MSDNPIRYGVVGLGRAGWDIHVAQLRKRSDARIVAVADSLEQRRNEAKEAFGCTTHKSLASLLKNDDVEVVVVATPSVRHGPDALKALRAGKHVVVEKPMSSDLAQADRMIKTARDADRHLFVHQNYRFRPEYRGIMSMLASGKIGRLYHVRAYTTAFARRNDWQTLAKNAGGVLNNTAVHTLDQLLQYMNVRIDRVLGDLQQIASAGDVEDHVKAFMIADNGCTADMEISMAQNVATPLPSWIFCGTTGTATIADRQMTLRWFDPAEAPPIEAVDGPVMTRKYGNADTLPWREEKIDLTQEDGGPMFYDNVREVLRQGGAMVITPESVREVMRVIKLIRRGTKFSGKAPAASKASQRAVATPAASA